MRSMTEEVVFWLKPSSAASLMDNDLSRLPSRHPPLKGRASGHSISSGFSRSLPHSRSDQMNPALAAGSSVMTKRETSTMVS